MAHSPAVYTGARRKMFGGEMTQPRMRESEACLRDRSKCPGPVYSPVLQGAITSTGDGGLNHAEVKGFYQTKLTQGCFQRAEGTPISFLVNLNVLGDPFCLPTRVTMNIPGLILGQHVLLASQVLVSLTNESALVQSSRCHY